MLKSVYVCVPIMWSYNIISTHKTIVYPCILMLGVHVILQKQILLNQ